MLRNVIGREIHAQTFQALSDTSRSIQYLTVFASFGKYDNPISCIQTIPYLFFPKVFAKTDLLYMNKTITLTKLSDVIRGKIYKETQKFYQTSSRTRNLVLNCVWKLGTITFIFLNYEKISRLQSFLCRNQKQAYVYK